MRRTIGFLLLSLALTGCNDDNPTPLAHALTALRAGDRADFLAAKTQAMEDFQKAMQPGGDLCLVTTADIVRYHTKYVVEKMDDEAVFKLPEEDRLLIALLLAGKHSVVHEDTYIYHSMIAGGVQETFADYGKAPKTQPCDGKEEQLNQALQSQTIDMRVDDEQRSAILEGWIDTLKAKYGDGFDDHMRQAANHLLNYGYQVQWPVPSEFADGRTL